MPEIVCFTDGNYFSFIKISAAIMGLNVCLSSVIFLPGCIIGLLHLDSWLLFLSVDVVTELAWNAGE